MRKHNAKLIRPHLTTRRAGAVAGIAFSILLMVSLILIWISVPSDPEEAGSWLPRSSKIVKFALNLLSFAGIAFLWFIGVLRDRIGVDEDRFFATVFLGSGLLFLAMLFAAAAVAGGTLMFYGAAPGRLIDSGMYTFGRTVTYQVMHTYALKMAAVFMFSTSTLSIRTGIFPRWMAFLGYGLAIVLLLSVGYVQWIPLVFPLWVLLISIHIFLRDPKADPGSDLLRKEPDGPNKERDGCNDLFFLSVRKATEIDRPVFYATGLRSDWYFACRLIGPKSHRHWPYQNLRCLT
jgi:hypothetical protein